MLKESKEEVYWLVHSVNAASNGIGMKSQWPAPHSSVALLI
jgi:hypothetical protein